MRPAMWFCFIPLMFLLQACPIGLDYSMAGAGQEKINKKLIGVWESDNPDGEISVVEFKENTATSLKATVITPGESYTLEEMEFTVWQTELNGKSFLVLKPENEDKYYHYCIRFNGDNEIVFHDVALLDGGTDAVTSTESLRDQVARSMEMEGWGAERTNLHRK